MTDELLPPSAADGATGEGAPAPVPVPAASPASAPVSPSVLDSAVWAGFEAYVSSREKIARATATVYFVFHHAVSQHATPENEAWYGKRRTERKAEIDAHNERIEEAKKAVAKALKGDLQKLKKRQQQANDPDTKAGLDADIKRVTEDSNARIRDLNAQRKVKLETRSDAEEHTELTKVVLQIDNPKQGPQVNRIARGVKGLRREWENTKQPPDIEAMTQFILDQGGFEALHERQLAHEGKSTKGGVEGTEGGKTPSSADETATSEETPLGRKADPALVEHFQTVVLTADALGEFPALEGHAEGSLVALIGRVGPDGIEVISDLGMDADEVLNLCMAMRDRRLIPGDAAAEFAGVALALGVLVEEGTRKGKRNETVEFKRRLSMIVAEGKARLLVSAINIDHSVVVHAEPKEGASDLLPVPGFRWLPADDLAAMTARLADAVGRRMVTLRADIGSRQVGRDMLPSDLAWISNSSPLASQGDPSALSVHPWLRLSPETPAPLDVDGFTPLGMATLSRASMVALARGNIGNWLAEKPGSKVGEKAAAIAKVVLSRSGVTVTTTQGTEAVSCITSTVRGQIQLSHRPRLLAQVLDAVARLASGPVELSPDDRGAMRFAFEDAHGRYSVFVPACDEKGVMQTARFHPIRVPHRDDE